MADEHKPEGSVPPLPNAGEAAGSGEKPPGKPASEAVKPQDSSPGSEAAKPEKPAAAAPPKAAPPKPAAPAAPKAPPTMAATPWESDLTRQLKAQFGEAIPEFSTYLGQNFLVAKPDSVIPILEYLKLESEFDYLVDLTAVHYPKRAEQFDLIYILYSFPRNERIRVKTMISETARPASATGVHATANWLEREVFDMFGIQFSGHPDLRRILMPEEWEGFPLRKDYPILKQDDGWVKENLGIESGQ